MRSFQGLSSSEALEKLAQYGKNQIEANRSFSSAKLLLSQFTDPIMILLLGATLLAMVLGQVIDSLIILGIVIPTALLGFYQERRAGLELLALTERVKLTAKVYRDGQEVEVPTDLLVPEDIVILRLGSQIPADLELLESNQLLVDESVLTGESFAVEKTAPELVYLGTHVAGGGAVGKVIATGKATKYGELAQKLAASDSMTSFEKGSADFGRFLMKVMLVLVIAIFIVNIFVQRSLFDSLLFSLALAVGLTPQFLTVIITISLTHGASKMAKQKVLVKRLDAIQNFGSMTVLCCDKTGTLTRGEVTLSGFYSVDGEKSKRVLELAAINASTQVHYQNPMDSAVLVVAEENQLNVKSSKALAEVPYDFVRRRLSVAVPDPTGPGSLLITKGAFLDVLALCTSANVNGEIVELHQVREKLVADHQTQASQGNRVLLLASKKISSLDNLSEQEVELTAEGLLIFVDPIKPGAAESVEKMKELGIRVVVITGDNPLTTARVTKEVGLQSEPFFTGSQVEEMSEQQLVEAAKTAAFFASVNPMQKERIIKAMSESEESVGYFGDGINDSLALRAADVGISVENAVDVARESADIVLLAKDLDVLSEGVRIGRQTFANTMTYIRVTISASFGNVVSVVVAAAFLPFLPLLPMQILLLNFLSGFAHLAIATDRVDKEDLGAPKRWDLKSLRKFMLIFGFLSSAVDIFLYWLLVGVFDVSPEVFRSVWFIESLLSESVAMLVLRSKRPFWKSRPSTALLVFSVLSGVVAIAITFTPVIGTTLGFAPSPVYLLGAVAVLLLGYAVANEVVKRRFMV